MTRFGFTLSFKAQIQKHLASPAFVWRYAVLCPPFMKCSRGHKTAARVERLERLDPSVFATGEHLG
jgi:hypothetical protein